MNIGTIVNPNIKGQIVIPQKIRQALGITEHTPLQINQVGQAVMLHPITSIVTSAESNEAVLDVLKKTAGSWAGDDWPETEKRRKKVEVAVAKKRRAAKW